MEDQRCKAESWLEKTLNKKKKKKKKKNASRDHSYFSSLWYDWTQHQPGIKPIKPFGQWFPLSSPFTISRATEPEGLFVTPSVMMSYGALRQGEVVPQTSAQFDPVRHLTMGDVILPFDRLEICVKAGKNLQKYNQRRNTTVPSRGPTDVSGLRSQELTDRLPDDVIQCLFSKHQPALSQLHTSGHSGRLH